MSKFFGALMLTFTVLASSGQAGAAGPVHQRVYFVCTDAKVQNFEASPAGWSTAAPTTPIADGGGCGQTDAAGYQGELGPVDLTTGRFAGTFTGNLGGMNLRFDTASVGTVQAGDRAEFDVTLLVDGHDALGGTRRLGVQPVRTSSGQFHSYFFSIAGLPYMDISEDRAHTVEFTVEPVNQPAVAWVYGAKEVPSGIEFNPTANHPYVITPNN